MPAQGGAPPRIDVILGRSDDMRAEVYVRATGLPATDSAPVITGTITGPESRLAITLPTVASLADLGPGPDGSAVARAILTEPGYWTPDLPHRYRLTATVAAGGATLATCDRRIGLRRLGVRGRSLWLEGRRWVPRGVACSPGEFDPSPLRATITAAVLDDASEDVCRHADETGVAIIARCSGDPLAACHRWAEHPSVMLMVLPRSLDTPRPETLAAVLRSIKGTMLMAADADGSRPPPPMPPGIDCLIVSLAAGAVPHDAWRQPPALPVLASRPADGDMAARRAACDHLQADLAAWRGESVASWDWAGYVATASRDR
ncbi:MAG: hypothetical protein ACKOEX_13850 [Planctomycetia bacterium]